LMTILISKSWGCLSLGPGMPFLDSDTCAEGGLFIYVRVFFPIWCHPWMDDGTDGWMEKALQKTTTTSFTICNLSELELAILTKWWPNTLNTPKYFWLASKHYR
jgi:hypothetical protein